MVLTTAKFGTLIDRVETKLEDAGYKPDVAVDQLTDVNHDRIHRLLAERDDINSTATTAINHQRESYGAEQWDNQFVHLASLEERDDTQMSGAELRCAVWDALPNSRFKRFQEAFCYPCHYIVPPFRIVGGTVVQYFGNQSIFNEMSLAGCLVSPDRIPEKLTEDLGLVEFDQSDRRRPYNRLKKKADPACIARLKEIWENTTPLQLGHHRLLRIDDENDEITGRILYVQEAENGRKAAHNNAYMPHERTVRYFDSAYSAHRKTAHERQLHMREISVLTQLQLDCADVASDLLDWKRDTPDEEKEAMRERTRELVLRTRSLLNSDAWQNKYKVETHDLLVDITDLEDRSGKTNVSACLAKLVAVNTRLRERLDEIPSKGGYNEQDQMTLETHLQAHERTFRDYRDRITKNASKLHERLELFGSRQLNRSQIEQQRDGLISTMQIDTDELCQIRLEPFVTYAKRLREKFDELHEAMDDRDLEAAQQTVIKMHVIGKFQAVRTCFDRIEQYMIEGEHLPISRVRDFVHTLNELFSSHQIFPDVVVESYTDAFESLQTQLQGIENRLQHYAAHDVDVSERTQIYKRLKEYLETFNLEALVCDLD